MEKILLTLIFICAVFYLIKHISKSFNKGKGCSGCHSKKKDCCS